MTDARQRAMSMVRTTASIPVRLAARVRPDAGERPPWERTILDDVAMRRPWNLLLKAERVRARARLGRLQDGVTVIIVNWNTREITRDVVTTVKRFSPPDTKVMVIDNASTDGSREMLRGLGGISARMLTANAGHGVALDAGIYWARTTVAVTLDSDAIPLAPGWLEPAVAPVRDGSAVLSGLRSRRGFVHPVYAAVDVDAFIRQRLSFQVHKTPEVAAGAEPDWGANAWDTGELMTRRVDPALVSFVDSVSRPYDLPGMTAGGVVYHHGGVSRAIDGGVDADSFALWRRAIATVCPGSEEWLP